jgi:ankyrin repeat protein
VAAFFKACEEGELARATELVKAGVHPSRAEDKSGRTALLYAARGGKLAVCQFLMKVGADLDACDKDGRNALHYAARRGNCEVACWLLDNGASVSSTDAHALTPLHQATLGKAPAMVELLLRRGADLHARDANGHTAFKLAKRFEADDNPASKATIRALLQWAKDHPVPAAAPSAVAPPKLPPA